MRAIFDKRIISKNNGMTLVEVLVASFVSVILIGAMGYTFSEAMSYWTRESQKMQMYEDASLFLFKLNKEIRRANFVAISPFGGEQNARLQLDVPSGAGTVVWNADYYFSKEEGIIRYNGNVGNRSFFHKKVLPLWDISDNSGSDTTYFDLYKVSFTFSNPGGWPSSSSGPAMVTTELFMRSPRGDTLYLSSKNARRNSK